MPLAQGSLDASPASAAELQREATTWIALAIASSVFCAGMCLGIGGALFCYWARQAAERGALEDAEAKLRWGKILTVGGSISGVLVTALSLFLRR
jgi:hypothetical protein